MKKCSKIRGEKGRESTLEMTEKAVEKAVQKTVGIEEMGEKSMGKTDREIGRRRNRKDG